MSFWRTFGFHTVSVVETILDREVFMLEELLDEEEILQEVKSQNKKLIDYLALPATLQRLFEFITQIPAIPPPNTNNYNDNNDNINNDNNDSNNINISTPNDNNDNNNNNINTTQTENEDEALLQGGDQKRKFKYPFIACEILCSDIWAITEAIFHDDTLLDVLYSFLDNPPPLDSLLASYTSRVAGVLLGRRTVECLAYLRRRDGVIPSFLMHLSNASIMELLLKIIGCEESPEGVGTLEWLCSTDLIPILVQKMSKDNHVTVHENAGQTLVDILAVSANITQSPLVAQLESPEHLNQLYHHILTPDNSSALLHGLTVIIELLKRHCKEHPDETSSTPLSGLPALLTVSIPHFHSLHQLLKTTTTLSSEESSVMLTTTGPLSPPLGFYRLKIIEFFLAIMRTRYDVIDSAIQSEGIVLTIIDLFFSYPWNNFLHIATEQIVQTVLEGQKNDIKLDLLIQAGLLDRIIETNRLHLTEVGAPGGPQRGYMGFLTNISLAISAVCTGNPDLEGAIEKHEGWKEYVATSLAEIRTIENKPLGGHRPTAFPPGESSGEDEEEQQDTDSIFDRYTKGLDFPEDGGEEGFEEFDDQNMSYDNTGMFINHHTGALSNPRAFEWTENDAEVEDGGHVRSGSDSDEEQDGEDLVWSERQIADEKPEGYEDVRGEEEEDEGDQINHDPNGDHSWKQHPTADAYKHEYDHNSANNNTPATNEPNGILLDAQSGVSS